jgi:uncharacterized protein YeaO (DUF488 family)
LEPLIVVDDQEWGPMTVDVARVYDPPVPADGARVLVDRLWPRGIAKASAESEGWSWCPEVAPSTELRRWYGHDPARFDEFVARYRQELGQPERATALAGLQDLQRQGALMLLTATKDVELSHAAVLARMLNESPLPPGRNAP